MHTLIIIIVIIIVIIIIIRRNSVGGLMIRLRTERPGNRIPVVATDFFQNIQTGSGYQLKRPWLEVNHSHPSSPKIKNKWNCTSTHHVCLHGVERKFIIIIIIIIIITIVIIIIIITVIFIKMGVQETVRERVHCILWFRTRTCGRPLRTRQA